MLTACASTPPAEQVMPPIIYTKPINMHSNKVAYLYWQLGHQHAEVAPPSTIIVPGVAGLAANIIIEEDHKNHPGKFTYTYGKAQQAVFMTSLRDALSQGHAFKQVILTEDTKSVPKDAVLIVINFKETRVASEYEYHQVTLDINMKIEAKNKATFDRTYLIKGNAKTGAFKDQQTDASEKMMSKLITGIEDWASQTKGI